MTHTPFCEFCKSIGHDVNSCRSLQLMQDNTWEAFWVQEEKNGGECGGTEKGGYQGGPRGGYGCGRGHNMVVEVVDPPHVSIVVKLVMSHMVLY
jgi:hypothetical protein